MTVTPTGTRHRRGLGFAALALACLGFSGPADASTADPARAVPARREVVFVESDVADYPALLESFGPSAKAVVLNARQNGLSEMARALRASGPVDAVHVISHGSSGTLKLGSLNLTADNLATQSKAFDDLRSALRPGADLLLYGCNIAAGDNGAAFLAKLAQTTNANVAASTNATGAAALGGDWILERSVGTLHTTSRNGGAYQHVLASGTISFSGAPGSSTATDGSGGSSDIPGITIQITSNLGLGWTFEQPYGVGSGIASGYITNSPSTLYTIKSSSTATPFWFKSIFIVDYGGYNPKIEGFRNGVSTGSVNLDTSANSFENTFNNSSGLPASIFSNVDEVRITPQSPTSPPASPNELYLTFNNIVIDNAAPTVTTNAATSITTTTATLNGTVNDGGATTTVSFDYGTTTGYGTNVGATTGGTVTAGSGDTAAAVNISGLACGTTYHFRAKGNNATGATDGSDASFTTSKCPQTITFNNPGAKNFGTAPTLTATSTSGLTPTFTSSTTGVCTITSGGTLTFVTAGSCTINADQAGDSTYAAAAQVPQTFTVNAIVPGAPTIGTATAGDAQANVTFTAPASNGGAAITTYTATASSGGATGSCAGPAACTITVTGLTNGTAYTFTVTASNSAGTGSASAASNSATPMGNQSITFANPGAQTFGTSPTLTATATSSLSVTFTSSTTGVCTITSGGALTFLTAGTCTINADQAGNGAFNAAPQVSRTFTVNAIVPGAPTIGTATAGDTQATVTFSAPASNGGAAITTYTATASPGGSTGTCAGPAACTITVTGLSNGTAYTFTVTATNSAGTGPASAPSNSVTPKGAQTITFANPGAQNFGTSPTLTATTTSSLTVSFTSSTTGVCTITSGGALTFVTTGTCTINADQAGNGSFLAASQVSRSFSVNAVVPGAPTIGIATPGDTQATITFSAPASNGGASITGYTVTSNPGGLTGTGGGSPIVVSGLSNGTSYTFTVTATNSAGTGSASAASNAVTPAPGPGVVSVAVPANGTYKAGTNLDFTITWDQNTNVTGTPQLALTIGVTTVHANYVSSPTATTTLFRYTVLPGQTDSDGITIGALTLNGGTIQSGIGVNATLTLNSVASTTSVLVDTTAPTLPAANIVVNNQSDPHKVILTFSEALDGSTIGSGGSWTVTGNSGTPSYSVASVAKTAASQITLTLNAVDVSNVATTIFNTAANGHLKVTPPSSLADVAGNTYAAGLVTEAGATHVLDVTAPTLSAVAASGATSSGGSLTATASEKALGYWIAVPQGATAPSVAQVLAGSSYGAVTVAAHGFGALPGGSPGSLALSGLGASTAYDIYIAAQDAAGNPSASAYATTLTTASAATPITPLPTPAPVTGIGSLPVVLNMQTGNGPALANCVADMVRQILGGSASYLGQTASGAMQVAWNGQILSFYPLAASATDTRFNGVSTTNRNPLEAITSCGTLTVTPAIRNLNEFGALLGAMGLSAQVSQQGVITIPVNGTYYVARPDFVVTPGTPGAPQLIVGPDGLYRFSDSSGNTQILHPAFLDTDALQAQVSGFGAAMVVEIDGTVRMALGNGQQFILTPDLILGGIPPEIGLALLWPDGPARYRYRINLQQFQGYSQGLSYAPKP